jgi:hypothetical protein
MIEAALEREANLPPKLRRHAQFERVVCLDTSAPTVLRVARGVREGESKWERNIYLPGAWPVRWWLPATRCVRAPRPHFTFH